MCLLAVYLFIFSTHLFYILFLCFPNNNTITNIQAFNYIANKGYARMSREDEKHWVDLMNVIHDSVKGGMKYNTGTLLMVLSRPMDSSKPASTPAPKKE